MEIIRPSAARIFHKKLQSLGLKPRSLTVKGVNRVQWTAALHRHFKMAQALSSGHLLIANQIRLGLKGYAHIPRRTKVMGILNVTPDSFSDGGKALEPARALDQALRMQAEGADIIAVGGESTRPGAKDVPARDELMRVLPVLRLLVRKLKIPISIDTTKAEVAQRAVKEGATLVNDISALRGDPRMADTVRRLGVPVVLMHMKGHPRTMQNNPRYREVIGEILSFFRSRVHFALERGIPWKNLILDPGFGFGKTPWHNMELTRRLWEF